MAGKSYLYTTLIDSSSSYDLGTLMGGPAGLLKISVANSVGVPSFAIPGTDYIQNLASTTGFQITESSSSSEINLPTPTAGNLLVSNGNRFTTFSTNDVNKVLKVTNIAPLNIEWVAEGGSGHPSTWSQFPADADMNLKNNLVYQNIKNINNFELIVQSTSFNPATNLTLYVTSANFYEYLIFKQTPTLSSNIVQGLYSDISANFYAANGSLLVGTGEYFTNVSIGTNNQILSASNGGFPEWRSSTAGDPSTWSQYPATQNVIFNHNEIDDLNLLGINQTSTVPTILNNQGIYAVNQNGLPYFVSSKFNQSYFILSDEQDYALAGSLLVGNGANYTPLSPSEDANSVLTIVSTSSGVTPAWVNPNSESPNFAVVDCVMWISAGYVGMPAYTYNNGLNGVGATLTYNTNFAMTSSLIDNYNGASGTEGIAVGTRILVVDNNNPTYSGIYSLTQVGSGSTPPVLTRTTDFDTTAEMQFGKRIYVTPYTPIIFLVTGGNPCQAISTFSNQTITLMSDNITIGTTPLSFYSSVFTENAYITSVSGEGAIVQNPLGNSYARAYMPDGGRKFYPTSFVVTTVLGGASSNMSSAVISLGRMISAENQGSYAAFTDNFNFNPATLEDLNQMYIVSPNPNVATILGPNDHMAFNVAVAGTVNVGTFTLYIKYFGKWL